MNTENNSREITIKDLAHMITGQDQKFERLENNIKTIKQEMKEGFVHQEQHLGIIMDKKIADFALIVARGFESNEKIFKEIKQDITEVKEELTEFKENTGGNFRRIEQKLGFSPLLKKFSQN